MSATINRERFDEQVKHPGKFEGEPAYVPYFWEQSLDGCFDVVVWDSGGTIFYAPIDAEDAAIFPELTEDVGKFIVLEESEQGFVYANIVNQSQIDAWEDDAASEAQDND